MYKMFRKKQPITQKGRYQYVDRFSSGWHIFQTLYSFNVQTIYPVFRMPAAIALIVPSNGFIMVVCLSFS